MHLGSPSGPSSTSFFSRARRRLCKFALRTTSVPTRCSRRRGRESHASLRSLRTRAAAPFSSCRLEAELDARESTWCCRIAVRPARREAPLCAELELAESAERPPGVSIRTGNPPSAKSRDSRHTSRGAPASREYSKRCHKKLYDRTEDATTYTPAPITFRFLFPFNKELLICARARVLPARDRHVS